MLMVRSAATDTFNSIHSSNSGIKNFFFFKLGKNLRLVFAFECETEFPNIGRLPVNSHTLLMTFYFGSANMHHYSLNSKQLFPNIFERKVYCICDTSLRVDVKAKKAVIYKPQSPNYQLIPKHPAHSCQTHSIYHQA